MNFPGGSICSSNRHEFSRRAYRKNMFFQEDSICSSNRLYYLIEQILIFPETLSSPRTHKSFQENPMPCTYRHFPFSNRYFANKSRWLLLSFVRRTDMIFPGASICSSNRHEFFRRSYRKDMFFQGGSICSSNRPYYLIEQILIFSETLI